MEIVIYKPKNKILQDYIDCFYTFKRSADDEPLTYFGFPSNIIFVTICQNAKISINDSELTIENINNKEIKSILIVDNKKQASTTYRGITNEITIYFKPLGINAFIHKPLSEYIKGNISDFNPFHDYTKNIEKLFTISEDDAKIEFLENYFISKLKIFEHSFLHKIVKSIVNNHVPKMNVTQLAEFHSISRTTLHKQFLLHLGISPSQFIKIERFRNAIKLFTRSASHDQLLDIAYLVEYFDQSHMSKDFKSLTGDTPKIFFSKLNQVDNQINWIFL